MKFYSDTKGLLVWDSIKNKALCRFSNGEIETDGYIKERLLSLGYKHDIETEEQHDEVKVSIDISTMNIKEMKQLAKDNGLKGYSNSTKEELIKMLEGLI